MDAYLILIACSEMHTLFLWISRVPYRKSNVLKSSEQIKYKAIQWSVMVLWIIWYNIILYILPGTNEIIMNQFSDRARIDIDKRPQLISLFIW